MSSLWYEQAWQHIVAKLERTSQRIGDRFPEASKDGVYQFVNSSHWVAGFWPGLLWLAYRSNGNPRLRQIAESCERKLAQTLIDYDELHHDVGFMFSLSSVAQYKLTGNLQAQMHARKAANLLAGRYNPAGEFIRAWPNWDGEDHTGWAIIDCMMNLPLLYWASEVIEDPRYRQIAMRHADTVIRNFLQEDHTVNHIVHFNPETGERIKSLAGQGHASDSAWSRGLSWAVHGFALSYVYTGKSEYLEVARKTADAFIRNLPEDLIPYWDFKLSNKEGAPRDASAAACAASGMLEIARVLGVQEEGRIYQEMAERMLEALFYKCTDWESDEEGILLHSTGFHSKDDNVDVPIIYGDFYFAEAIAKLNGERGRFW